MEMCQAALEKNIGVFSITDHYDYEGPGQDLTQLNAAIKQSVADLTAAKEFFKGKMEVLTGVELGQPLDNQPEAEALQAAYPFDFILAGLHNAPGRIDLFDYDPKDESCDLDAELELYFRHTLDIISWGRFDSLAHLTYPFRYIIRLGMSDYPFGKWDDLLDAAVKALVDKGLAIELNAGGFRPSLANPNIPFYAIPDAKWIRRYRELGGERLTMGTDSHRPFHVGVGLENCMAIAKEAGFRDLCYFVDRQPRFVRF